MRTSFGLASLIAFALGLLAWAGIWFLNADISSRLTARATNNEAVNAQNVQQGSAIELHALVADTALQRASLDATVDTDVVGIASQINAVGKASGAQTIIGSASALGSVASSTGVSELEFVVQSTGTFAQVWRAAQLFETLPIPSGVSELDLEQVSGAQGGAWQLTTHLIVLTSAQISS